MCVGCVSKKLCLPHRGFATKPQRVCKRCADFVQVRLLAKAVKTFVDDKAHLYDTVSRRAEPDEQVRLMSLCSRIIRRAERSFSASNDFFNAMSNRAAPNGVEREHENGSSPQTNEDEAAAAQRTALNFSLCVAPRAVQFVKNRPNLPPATFKEITHAFPAPMQNSDPLAILTQAHLPPPAASFTRIRSALNNMHRTAVETEPQEMPAIVAHPSYY